MAFPDTVAYTPNLNFYRLTGGDMAASAGASAMAAEALSAAMTAELTSLGVNTASTATIGWAGEGGATMTLSAAQMMDVFGLAIAWLQEHAAAASSIVEAHQTAAQTMVPGPVCDQNREDYAMLAATNWFGQHTMPMGALDFAYFGEHWPHNATAMAVYQSVVEAALAILSTPPPMDPVAANPAGALAGVAQAAAQAAGQTALQTGAQTMSATAEAPVAAGQGAGSSMMQGMSQMMQMPMQMMSSLPQMLSQAPQMLGQVMQTGMGLLGPLMQGMGAANPADAASLAGSATPGLGGLPGGAAGLGGGGGGGFGLSGASPVASTFTRPASSFNTPNAPKLPGGWGGTTGAPEPVATPGAAGMGGNGGLYGAPHGAGREGDKGADRKTPARTMQLTGRPEYGRGE